MCNELERITFCIQALLYFAQPLWNSLQGHPWWCYTDWPCTQDIGSSALVSVDYTSLPSLFSSHGQLISITLTCLLVLSMTVASILLAFIWVVSANNGTSQKAVACSFSYSGLGVTCENHSSTLVMRSKDLRTSKKHEKHSSSLTFSSSHLFLISFPCHLSSDTVDYYHHHHYYYYYYYYYLILIIVLFSVKYKYDPSVVEWHLPASK